MNKVITEAKAIDAAAPVRADEPNALIPVSRLDAARRHFMAGRISRAAYLFAGLPAPRTGEGADMRRWLFLLFALACYGKGDPGGAMAAHRRLPPDVMPSLRYRMLIAGGAFAEASRLRKSADFPASTIADFRWTLSRQALWSHRLDRGLKLYDARVEAENFAAILPGWLRHDPALVGTDRPAVLFEQGFGDTLFHAAQMRAMGARPSRVIGPPRIAALAWLIWPEADFHSRRDPSGPLEGATVACAGDWLALRCARDGALGPLSPFPGVAASARRRGFGICWRGGSAQNRREEREVPLQLFLDLLPRGGWSYVALQHDLSEAERRLLNRRDDIVTAPLDLTADDLATLRMIAGLEGVISVDSANLHAAGLTATPSLSLMNPRSHWYWGADAKVESIYAGAETLPLAELSHEALKDWIARTRADAAPEPPTGLAAETPVFITGVPRSRTSLVAGALAAAGLRLGETITGDAENPTGYFENRTVREEVLKPLLRSGGYDPLGVMDLPPPDWRPATPALADQLAARLRPGEGPWGFKDPKLLLMWRAWAATFPRALWVVVRRPAEEVMASCLRTGFMRRHSDAPEFWRHFVRAYEARADALVASRAVAEIRSDDLMAGRGFDGDARRSLERAGLDVDAAEAFVKAHTA